jgi:multidrug efflux pump subunit AcrA (membrane-fusion protein)
MSTANTAASPRVHVRGWVFFALILCVAALAATAAAFWWPPLREKISGILGSVSDQHDSTQDDHADHAHDHHDDPDVLELSDQARKNIGLKIDDVKLTDYERTLTIPGIVIERPGQSVIDVTAPLTGVVMQVYVTEGEAVTAGQKLFDLNLTHEDVVQGQADFLKIAQELDVVRNEVNRLEEVTRNGAIAGKTLLERKYEQQKAEAALRAQREALLLHGLSEEQVANILETRKLLPAITVFAPETTRSATDSNSAVLQIQELKVERGQHVNTGNSLAVLANHSELLIEGRAFEHEAAQISGALENGWTVSAIVESSDGRPIEIKGLQILYLDSRVETASRALHFYVALSNKLVRDSESSGRRYIVWRFKPGQRMQIQLPVEKWKDRIVLPLDAIAQDGIETYIFRQNGDCVVRQPVYVEFRDQFKAVIGNDGSLYPGDRIAMNAAHQLLVALKNKSGGGVDPHAGHTH